MEALALQWYFVAYPSRAEKRQTLVTLSKRIGLNFAGFPKVGLAWDWTGVAWEATLLKRVTVPDPLDAFDVFGSEPCVRSVMRDMRGRIIVP